MHRSPQSRIVPFFKIDLVVFQETNGGGWCRAIEQKEKRDGCQIDGSSDSQNPPVRTVRRDLSTWCTWIYVIRYVLTWVFSSSNGDIEGFEEGVRGHWEDITPHRAILLLLYYSQVEIGRFSSMLFFSRDFSRTNLGNLYDY